MPKLHEIPEKSKIYEEVTDDSDYFIFDHIDGAYSYCISEKGAIVHLGASQELVPYLDGYKFKTEKPCTHSYDFVCEMCECSV